MELIEVSFFTVNSRDIDLDYRDVEWLALETNQYHSVISEVAPNYCISECFVDNENYSITSMGFLSTVVDIMAIWIKFAHSRQFMFLMLMFILTISCLTVSNLPWFIDLISQVPMQYCSLQHQILFSSPDTPTTEHHFRFGPATSFFPELLVVLCSFPAVYEHLPT